MQVGPSQEMVFLSNIVPMHCFWRPAACRHHGSTGSPWWPLVRPPCLQACSLHLPSHAECGCLQVEELVELTPLSNALVGKPGLTGLSVEARKRLTIAVELVSCLRWVCCGQCTARCRCGLYFGSGRAWPQLCGLP